MQRTDVMGDEQHGKFGSGTVSAFTEHGEGILREKSRRVQVPGVLPGETAFYAIRGRNRGVRLASLEGVAQPSSDRVAPPCPYVGVCGGCRTQHVAYGVQRVLKLERLRTDFSQADIPCPIANVEAVGEPLRYRNRMDFAFGHDGRLGLREAGRWWKIIDAQTCFLPSEPVVEILNLVRDWALDSGLPFYDRKRHEGFFRALVVREGRRTGERLVMLVTDTPAQDVSRPLAKLVDLLGERATSVVLGIHTGWSDTSAAEDLRPLKGGPFVHEEVDGIRYRIGPNTFFQTNTDGALALQRAVLSYAGPVDGRRVLDLYCGIGFFTLAFAKAGAKAVGVEISPESVACAWENARLNRLPAQFFTQTAESFDWQASAPDLVIVDPPRSGLHPSAIKALLAHAPPTLVYVSCNHKSLLRDAATLAPAYRLEAVRAFDLFPQTPHMEVVSKFVLH